MHETIEKGGRPYLVVTLIDAGDGHVEPVVELSCEWTLCSSCGGSGGSSSHLGSFTAEEWAEEWAAEDPEFREDYMSGRFDRPCPACEGLRVVAEPPRRESLSDRKQIAALNVYEEDRRETARGRALARAKMRLFDDDRGRRAVSPFKALDPSRETRST